jgi:hypothetical protein
MFRPPILCLQLCGFTTVPLVPSDYPKMLICRAIYAPKTSIILGITKCSFFGNQFGNTSEILVTTTLVPPIRAAYYASAKLKI